MARHELPAVLHVRLDMSPAQREALDKITRLLSDLSDALSVFVQADTEDTGQPDTRTSGPAVLSDAELSAQGLDTVVRADTSAGQTVSAASNVDPDILEWIKAESLRVVRAETVRAQASAGQTVSDHRSDCPLCRDGIPHGHHVRDTRDDWARTFGHCRLD